MHKECLFHGKKYSPTGPPEHHLNWVCGTNQKPAKISQQGKNLKSLISPPLPFPTLLPSLDLQFLASLPRPCFRVEVKNQ